MQKIGIITDTNSGMSQAEARECGVTLMPMPFTVNGRNYVENVNMTYREFFERLADGAQVATSQPSPEDVISCWNLYRNGELVSVDLFGASEVLTDGLVFSVMFPYMEDLSGLSLVPEYSEAGEKPDEAIVLEPENRD